MEQPKTFTAVCAEFVDNPLWSFHFMVPDDITKHFVGQNENRVIVVLNGKTKLHRALMPDGNGGYYIMLNKELRKKLNLSAGLELFVEMGPDVSVYGLPMPEEMSELMAIDEEGDKLFHALTRGKQRSLLYIIGKPKRSETRLQKAVVVLEHLKTWNGKLDFKQLNEDFKNARKL